MSGGEVRDKGAGKVVASTLPTCWGGRGVALYYICICIDCVDVQGKALAYNMSMPFGTEGGFRNIYLALFERMGRGRRPIYILCLELRRWHAI